MLLAGVFRALIQDMADIIPTTEERRLLSILNDGWWQQNAPARGIKDTRISDGKLTEAGITSVIELPGKTTPETLKREVPLLRTMLRVKDDDLLVIAPGGDASRVQLAVRTRRVTDTFDMHWHPGVTSLGVDTVTGKEVHLPLHSQIQISGAKGSGKSWAMRPLMAAAYCSPLYEMVYIDPKMVEGVIWKNLIRTAIGSDEIPETLDWVDEEMVRRSHLMAARNATVWDPETMGPYLIVIVDEGRDTLSTLRLQEKQYAKLARMASKEEGVEDLDLTPGMLKLIRASSMGRAWGVFVWWATQYPIVSGANPGIDTNIDANADWRFSLRVAKEQHARVALDADADYGPHLIPATHANRGHGYLGGHGPNLIRTWTVTDAMVRSLKDRPMIPSSAPLVPGKDIAAYTPMDAARLALRQGGAWTSFRLAKATGCGTSEAKLLLDALVRNKEAVRQGDNYTYR